MAATNIKNCLSFHKTADNLFIGLGQEPDVDTLKTMKILLCRYGKSSSRLFVDVRSLSGAVATTVSRVRTVLLSAPILPKNVYFKGELGFSFAVDGNKIIIKKKGSTTGTGNRQKINALFVKSKRLCRCAQHCCPADSSNGHCCQQHNEKEFDHEQCSKS